MRPGLNISFVLALLLLGAPGVALAKDPLPPPAPARPVDFTTVLKTLDGSPILRPHGYDAHGRPDVHDVKGPDGRMRPELWVEPMTAGFVAVDALVRLRLPEDQQPGDSTLERYALAMRIHDAKAAVALTAADRALLVDRIKRDTQDFSAEMLGAALQIIDPAALAGVSTPAPAAKK